MRVVPKVTAGWAFERVEAARCVAAGENGVIKRADEGSGAAGEIGDPQALHRVRASPVRPQPGGGELGQQGGGHRQGVEGGEKLSVGDELLEHPPREIVQARRAHVRQFARHAVKTVQHPVRLNRRHLRQQVRRDSENRPVVDVLHDPPPAVEGSYLVEPDRALQFIQQGDALPSLDARMEHGGVGHDGDRHAVGLLARRLVEMGGDAPVDVLLRRLQNVGGVGDALLEHVRRPGDEGFGEGDRLQAVRHVVDAAVEPASFRPPLTVPGFRLGKNAVGEGRPSDGVLDCVLGDGSQLRRDAEGDGVLYPSAVALQALAQAGGGVGLHRGGGVEFRLKRHRRTPRRREKDVRLPARRAQQDAGPLDADGVLPQRMLSAQRAPERGVEDRLGRGRPRHGVESPMFGADFEAILRRADSKGQTGLPAPRALVQENRAAAYGAARSRSGSMMASTSISIRASGGPSREISMRVLAGRTFLKYLKRSSECL